MDIDNLKIKWEPLLKNPSWYITIIPELERLWKDCELRNNQEKDAIKEKLYGFFELHLKNGDIALEKSHQDTDSERKLIDTIVIHHTHNHVGMTSGRLSAIELIRLYAPNFYRDRALKGKAIYSGHERNGKQVFWPYHWLIRSDGGVERLLEDPEIGWHAGNWDINCRSIAICLDNNYENSKPSEKEVQSIVNLIKDHYGRVPTERIYGHREINNKTTCPSNLFLTDGKHKGWKEEIIEKLSLF